MEGSQCLTCLHYNLKVATLVPKLSGQHAMISKSVQDPITTIRMEPGVTPTSWLTMAAKWLTLKSLEPMKVTWDLFATIRQQSKKSLEVRRRMLRIEMTTFCKGRPSYLTLGQDMEWAFCRWINASKSIDCQSHDATLMTLFRRRSSTARGNLLQWMLWRREMYFCAGLLLQWMLLQGRERSQSALVSMLRAFLEPSSPVLSLTCKLTIKSRAVNCLR